MTCASYNSVAYKWYFLFLVVKTLKTVQTFLSVNIKDSFCNKYCGMSLHDVGGKFVQTLDSGWDGVGDGEIYTGMGMGMANFLWGRGRDGENFMGTGWGWGRDGDNFIYRVTLYSDALNKFLV